MGRWPFWRKLCVLGFFNPSLLGGLLLLWLSLANWYRNDLTGDLFFKIVDPLQSNQQQVDQRFFVELVELLAVKLF